MKIQKRHTFLFTAIALLAALTGCLPTYVGDPEKAVIDPGLIGIWHTAKDDQNQLWAVHKMNEHCYLVQAYIIKTGDDGKPALEGVVTSRAWLAQIEGQTFMSMETYNSEALLAPHTEAAKNRYLVARVINGKNGLTVQGITPEFFKDTPLTSPAQLEQAIKENLNKEELYTEKTVYTRVDPANREKLKDLLELIK